MDNNQSARLIVEELKSQLLRRQTTKERFKLPFETDMVAELLHTAIFTEVRMRDREFLRTEAYREQVLTIAEWLRGETSKFGLLLCGLCGNGKTTFVKAIQQVINVAAIPVNPEFATEKYGMQIHDARKLAMLCRIDNKRFQQICNLRMLAIDDLGTEPFEVVDFGNSMNPMSDLILERYDKRLFTIVTTNLTPEQLREKYGDRVADRIKEMMEKVVFKNASFRSL